MVNQHWKSHAISKSEIGSYYPVTETSLLNLNLILKPTETNFIVKPSKNGTRCLAMFQMQGKLHYLRQLSAQDNWILVRIYIYCININCFFLYTITLKFFYYFFFYFSLPPVYFLSCSDGFPLCRTTHMQMQMQRNFILYFFAPIVVSL